MARFALMTAPYFMSLLLFISLCTLQATSYIVGPWGGSGGCQWAYSVKGLISHISISYDTAVHSISFTSQDVNGYLDHSDRFGSTNGTKNAEIDIDVKLEKLNSISGTFGTYQSALLITSLSFSTDSNKVFGPFGTATGMYFSVPIQNGTINGVYGNCGYLLDSIGLSITSRIVGPWGGLGGIPWHYEPQNPISGISITHDTVIDTIIITSHDANGNLLQSPKFGSRDGTKSDVINIDVNVEKFNSISGTYGTYGNMVVLTSLSFTMDSGKGFGPFGAATGTTLSLPIENGYISGFHGRSGSVIDSIGVYLKST